MTTQAATPATEVQVEAYTAELLARLGVGPGASMEELERAHDQRVDFLAKAPAEMADWAQQEIGRVDEAYALLTDPHADIPAAAAADLAERGVADAPLSASAAPATTAPQPPRMAHSTKVLLLVALAAAVIFGVYKWGGDSGVPALTGQPTDSSSAAAPQLDTAKVGAAMQKISANPKDVAALKELGDLYFQAGDYPDGDRVGVQGPRDRAPGRHRPTGPRRRAVQLGRLGGREGQLEEGRELDARNAEAHYDLGFLARAWSRWTWTRPRLNGRRWLTSTPSRSSPSRSPPTSRVLPSRARPRASDMTSIGILVALLAGFVSFASPCCLPLVPVYVGYMVGTTPPDAPNRRQVALRQSLAFVAGFTAVFVTLWASVGLIGYLVRDYVDILRIVGGAVLIVMGLHVAELITIPTLHREMRVPVSMVTGGVAQPGSVGTMVAPSYTRSSLLGVVFAAGWTPCVGPILGGIIGLASVSQSVGEGHRPAGRVRRGPGHPVRAGRHRGHAVNGRLGWFRTTTQWCRWSPARCS